MKIKRIEKDSPEFEGYSVYEVEDPALNEPCFYLAVNNTSKLVNIYSIGENGEPNRVDTTVLKFRSELPTTLNKDGTLIFNDPDNLDQFLVDLLGEYAPILAQDLKLQFDQTSSTAVSMELSQDETPTGEVEFDIAKYSDDPYAGLDPEAVEKLKELGSEDETGGEGGDPFAGGGEGALPSSGEGEELPPLDDEELPPLDDEEDEEPA